MDSEWDRKVLKVVVGAFCSPAQLSDFGIRAHDINKTTQNVLGTIDESERLYKSAVEETQDNLSKLINDLEIRVSKIKKKKLDMAMDYTDQQLGELNDEMEDIIQRVEDWKLVRTPGESDKHKRRLEMMEKNVYIKIIKDRKPLNSLIITPGS